MTTLAITALTQILIMFMLILVGIVSYRIKLIDKETNRKLSDLVLQLVNPVVIFISYQRDFNSSMLRGLIISLILATVTHTVAVIVSPILLHRKKQQPDNAIEQFAVIYSNCGFIGIPLVNGIIGSEGVFYLTAYMTIFNLFVWTHGVIIMTGKKDVKTIAKAFLSPSVIATLTGFLFFAVQIRLPGIVINTMNYLGNMNTPLAMLVAGATIAQTDIVKLLGKLRIYYVCFLKLIVIPIAALFIFLPFGIPKIVLLTSVLAASCPTAVTITLFAIRYGKNYYYASELFTVTTILSILTIPVVMTITGFFV
jgi:predicted permease